MKKVIFVALFFLGICLSVKAQKSYAAFDNVPLQDVLTHLEGLHQITFSYDDENIKNKFVQTDSGLYTLQEMLHLVLDPVYLSFEFVDSKFVLLIPLERNNPIDFLCGYIKNDEGEPIEFATVCNSSLSHMVVSDKSGFFKIPLDKTDKAITLSYLGYKSYIVDLEKASNTPCRTYNLQVENISFAPIILKEYLTDGIKQTENGSTVVISPEEMDVLPGSVEKDVLAAISFLPGITAHGESLDGIHIRGGTPDQNLVLWDGIPMYHTSHFFGTISAFNPNIIDHVDVYRSGIGSEYGGRVSSVIDIHSREQITDKFRLGTGINWTHFYMDMDIPLWKNSSLMISTRRSITDIISTPTFVRYAEKVFQGTKVEEGNFNDPELQFSDEFRFNDANIKWMMDYGRNKFRFVSIGALNSLNFKSDIEEWNVLSIEELNLRNGGVNLSWERQWNENYKTTLQLTNSEYRYDYNLGFKSQGNAPDPAFAFFSQNSITDGGLNWDNELVITENQNAAFGYQFTENATSLDINTIDRRDTTENSLNFQNRLHALYSDYSLKLPKVLQLDIGLRYLYQEDLRNNYFEPRIALATNVTDRLKLKVSTGKHFQFVSQLVAFNTNNLGLNNQIWVTANNAGEDNDVTIPVIESNQWMGGFIYQKGNWTLDVEGYVKELAGITTFSSSFVDLQEKPFSSGNSRIQGIDFLLKKRMGRYRTWISYSLSRTKYEFPEISLDPIIASHDQTHILNWVHLYKYKTWEFSLGLEYRSGLPATEAALVDGEIDFGATNAIRLPRYLRVDGSIIYNFGKEGGFNGFIAFSVQNLSNRSNTLSRRYILEEIEAGSPANLITINEQGLQFTPNVSLNIRIN